MLSLDFRLVIQYICLSFIHILSIIDLVCYFHVSCVSNWSPRYLTFCFVCLMCVPSNWIFGGFCFRSVNVIWLHLLGFSSVCLSYSHFELLLPLYVTRGFFIIEIFAKNSRYHYSQFSPYVCICEAH